MGEDFVANAFANATEFTMPMQEYITRNAWGDVWQRPGLDMKTRSLVTGLCSLRWASSTNSGAMCAARSTTAPLRRRFKRCCCTPAFIAACPRRWMPRSAAEVIDGASQSLSPDGVYCPASSLCTRSAAVDALYLRMRRAR